ncbi:MAG: tyrosine--tRNA ligase [Candidatus Ancillula sp.]|jgi:tyrosyl-tRNA synthetase|nr:tyrosine--tRNA ligase [Candidatus Ancillula sp.]
MKLNSVELLGELEWRGLLFQSTDADALRKELEHPVSFYCGFDPTAASLHHGNLVQIILLRHLQNAGHKPFCVVGGATGLIGDPRMSGERNMNDEETVREWGKKVGSQLTKYLKIDGENAVQLLNNYDWTSKLTAIDFLRSVGKNFRVGSMIAKDTVKTRLEGEGLSYTEFSYQVLQGYDFYILNRDYGVKLQTGGQDQWGNLTSGLDLIHKMTGESVHVMTTPLVTKADGSKFGKSEGGAIWLDPEMMSPYEFYQFWLNVQDSEVVKLLKVFTFLGRDEIERLEAEVESNPGRREAQSVLAAEVTRFVHGDTALNEAVSASKALFGLSDLTELSAKVLGTALSGVEVFEFEGETQLGQLFVQTKLCASFSDFVRTVKAGGVYVNNEKVLDAKSNVDQKMLLNGGFLVLRKGKKSIAGAKMKGSE